ncbi:hypothetical protein CR513_16968, partial [Mucuna pruriens]
EYQKHQCSGNGEEPQTQEPDGEDYQQVQHRQQQLLVLQFIDSMHNYLSLFHALSSTLQQFFLLVLKLYSAATTLNIIKYDDTQLHFLLRKWVSSEHGSTLLEDENVQPQDSSAVSHFLICLVVRTAKVNMAKNLSGLADIPELSVELLCKLLSAFYRFKGERSKSLSVFGILISPKLLCTRGYMTFFAALETLKKIANMQSSLLYSFHRVLYTYSSLTARHLRH